MLIENVKVKHLESYEERYPYGDSYTVVHSDETWEGSITIRFTHSEIEDRNDDTIPDMIYDALSEELNYPRKLIKSELGLLLEETEVPDGLKVTAQFHGIN